MPARLAPRDVTILGGGVAAIEAALALIDLTDGAAHLTIVAPDEHVELQALAPARAFGLAGDASFSLAELASAREITWMQDSAVAIDTDAGVVRCASAREVSYEALVVAVGAARVAAYPTATTYYGSVSRADLVALRDEVAAGTVRSAAVIVPPGVGWALPAYELALMLAREARNAGTSMSMNVVTPEPNPFALFGPVGSTAVAELLDAAGIDLHTSAFPEVSAGRIDLRPGPATLFADRIVALPRAQAIPLRGLQKDPYGFIPVDGYGRVSGRNGVYAAGDCTTHPVKQGGLAALQADVIAAHIAADMGVDVASPTFRPVMRGKLITGDAEWYLRYPAAGGGGDGDAHDEPLWMPARKVWGKYLPRLLEPS